MKGLSAAQMSQRRFASTIRSLAMIRSRHFYPMLQKDEINQIIYMSETIELIVRARYIEYQKSYGSKHLAHESKTAAELEHEAFHGDPE